MGKETLYKNQSMQPIIKLLLFDCKGIRKYEENRDIWPQEVIQIRAEPIHQLMKNSTKILVHVTQIRDVI